VNYARIIAGRNRPCPCGSGVKFKKCCAKIPDRKGAPVEVELVVGVWSYLDVRTGADREYIIREGHGKYHGHREDVQKTQSRTHTGLLLAGLLSQLDPRLEGLHSLLPPPRRKGSSGTGQRRPPELEGL